ncbi:SBBP repeat-containing protein [Sorangium sp. So ce861]|uniref:SBBP repeat-containing protein n=1 Tax=Sorangium sp. So ce861 TaxID=3133323 RepID=UPI003F5D6A04
MAGEKRLAARIPVMMVGLAASAAGGCAPMIGADWDRYTSGEGGTHAWTIDIGEAGDQGGERVTVDDDGNVLIAGYFHEYLDFPTQSRGGADGFVIKLSHAGKPIEQKTFGGTDWDSCSAVEHDAYGNVIVAGWFEGTIDFDGVTLISEGRTDAFVAKLDANMNLLWVKTISGMDPEFVWGLGVDSQNDIVVAGEFYRTVTVLDSTTAMTSAGQTDIFIAKIDALGNHIWSKHFGGSDHQKAFDLAITPGDDVVVVGYSWGTASFGEAVITATELFDAFVAKLDKATGEPKWAKIFGDSGNQVFKSVAVDHQGNIFVAGDTGGPPRLGGSSLHYAGGIDVIVGAFDPDGKHLWSHSYGDAGDQLASAVAVDEAGNVLVSGSFASSIDFKGPLLEPRGEDDAFLAKLDRTGETVWAKSFGGAKSQRAADVAVDALGTIALTGSFEDSIELEGNTLTSAVDLDAFVIKLRP